LGVPDLQQAKQAINAPFNQLRAGGAWFQNNNSPTRHQSPTSVKGFSDHFNGGGIGSGGASGCLRGSAQQIIRNENNCGSGNCFDSSDLFGSLGTPTQNILATSAPTSNNGFGGQHDSKVFFNKNYIFFLFSSGCQQIFWLIFHSILI
jgi:hypothetical protein